MIRFRQHPVNSPLFWAIIPPPVRVCQGQTELAAPKVNLQSLGSAYFALNNRLSLFFFIKALPLAGGGIIPSNLSKGFDRRLW